MTQSGGSRRGRRRQGGRNRGRGGGGNRGGGGGRPPGDFFDFDRIKFLIKNRIDRRLNSIVSYPREWSKGFGTTRRRNKEVVTGSYRNIVDLGNFRAGMVTEWRDNELWIQYLAPYSQYVLSGFITKTGRVIPGRRPEDKLTERDFAFRNLF